MNLIKLLDEFIGIYSSKDKTIECDVKKVP